MKYNPDKHSRRSIRLRGYEYTQSGAYFVTICTQNRDCLLGEVVKGIMGANDAGQMIQSVWDELPQHYPGVDVDAFVVMPNHVHGIILLTADSKSNIGAGPCACPGNEQPDSTGQPRGVAPTMSLMNVVHRFKSLTTARYRQGVVQRRWQPFPGRLWQRNYYEHIIRHEEALDRAREYIVLNPLMWHLDAENPDTL